MTTNRYSRFALSAAFLATLGNVSAPAGPSDRVPFSYLRDRLAAERLSAKIYYRASRCDAIWGPQLVRGLVRHLAGIHSIRAMFGKDLGVKVSEVSPRLLSINIGRIPQSVFSIRIASLKLHRLQQYEPMLALGALQSTPEFISAEKKNGLSSASAGPVFYAGEPEEHDPHLPAELRNVTPDEVLDLVAKTFGGLIEYQECPSSHEFRLDYDGWGGRLRLQSNDEASISRGRRAIHAMFTQNDTNRDGCLSASEWDAAQRVAAEAGYRNGDAESLRLREAFLKQAQDAYKVLDRNGDGCLSEEEFLGHSGETTPE